MMAAVYAIYVKGLCQPNPDGWMAWAFLAINAETGEIVERQLGAVPPPAIKDEKRATNFIAEYGAIIKALDWLRTRGTPSALIYASLKSALARIGGSWPPDGTTFTERTLAKVLDRAAGLSVRWEWVATEHNPANPLAMAAYQQATGRPATDWSKRRQGAA